MILKNKKELDRFLRFAVVGTIGAVIDLAFFNLFTVGFGLPALVAQAFSFLLAVISNFLWNRFWTYPDSRNKAIARQLGQFFIVSVIGLTIRTLIFDALEKSLEWVASNIVTSNFVISPVTLGHNMALATVIIVIMFWNFFVNRFWTYNDVD
jgi:putative flippase GtrA